MIDLFASNSSEPVFIDLQDKVSRQQSTIPDYKMSEFIYDITLTN